MERKGKETNLWKEFAKAKQLFDSDPMPSMWTLLIRRKLNYNFFMKKNFKVSLFVRERAGGHTARRVQNTFLI